MRYWSIPIRIVCVPGWDVINFEINLSLGISMRLKFLDVYSLYYKH